METLTITLTPEIKEYVEERAGRDGSTISACLEGILREAMRREEVLKEVRVKLVEALDEGPGTPLTRADWDELRREIRDRHASEPRQADARTA